MCWDVLILFPFLSFFPVSSTHAVMLTTISWLWYWLNGSASLHALYWDKNKLAIYIMISSSAALGIGILDSYVSLMCFCYGMSSGVLLYTLVSFNRLLCFAIVLALLILHKHVRVSHVLKYGSVGLSDCGFPRSSFFFSIEVLYILVYWKVHSETSQALLQVRYRFRKWCITCYSFGFQTSMISFAFLNPAVIGANPTVSSSLSNRCLWTLVPFIVVTGSFCFFLGEGGLRMRT